MKNEQVCGNCRWVRRNKFGDLVCVNGETECCGGWVEMHHSCAEWEERG